jgi:DNA-binding transcriptional ArsR family regulator
MVRALLEISEYKGAGRSLQFLCAQLKSAVGESSGRSSMPSPELLSMHVEPQEFWRLCEQDADFVPKAAELARLLHRGYCQRTRKDVEKKGAQTDFDSLPEDLQKANVAQALRIPAILRLAGMSLEEGEVVPFERLIESRRPDEKRLRKHLAEPDRLEVLAEAEHNGWMVERMLSGWTFSRKKDEDKKLHNCLIPYSQLSEKIKDYDRLTITGKLAPRDKPEEEQFGYVDIVKIVGLRVVLELKNAKKTTRTTGKS